MTLQVVAAAAAATTINFQRPSKVRLCDIFDAPCGYFVQFHDHKYFSSAIYYYDSFAVRVVQC